MTLSDICKIIVDCPHSTAEDEGAGIPLIRTPNIGKGRFVLEGVHRVCDSVYNQRCARAIPQDDDIIFAREAPAGNAAIIKNGQKVCLGQRTVLIRPDAAKVIPDYLVYYLLAPKQQYKLLGTANGATVAHVNLPTIREMKVDNLPPLPVQRRIADILSAYDDLIENNRKQIKLQEEAAQRLYKEWFIDLRFPGHEHTPIINGVPKGWMKKSISVFFETVLGGTPSRSNKNFWGGTIPWINSGAVNKTRIYEASEFITDEGLRKSATKLMPKHTTVLAITGATLGQVSYTEIDVCANQSVVGIIPCSEEISEYLFMYISNNIGAIISKATGGAQQHINKDIVNDYPFLLPAPSVISDFYKIMTPLFNTTFLRFWENKYLVQSRDSMLFKIMNDEANSLMRNCR